jgi:hypothetical protein
MSSTPQGDTIGQERVQRVHSPTPRRVLCEMVEAKGRIWGMGGVGVLALELDDLPCTSLMLCGVCSTVVRVGL